jgi:hypothetical protein
MEAKVQVPGTMKKEGIPLNAGKVVELSNPDRKVVDIAMAELKTDELITISYKVLLPNKVKLNFKN